MSETDKYFNILGLKPGASKEEIKEVYKDLIYVWRKLKEINMTCEVVKAYIAEKPKVMEKKDDLQHALKMEKKEFTSISCRENGGFQSPSKHPFSQSPPHVNQIIQEIVGYAGFWKRFVAFIIDFLIVYVVAIVIGAVLGISITLRRPITQEEVSGLEYLLGAIISWLYWSVMESSYKQATLGKMALGIIVTDYEGNRISFGRATGRHFAKILSSLILCFGFIMAGFTVKKQTLHDMIAGCLVVKSKKV